MSYELLLERIAELRKAATPPPWKVDPEDMMGPGSWGIHHPATMGQIFYVGDPYPRGDNSPVENCYLAAPAHEYAACVEALVAIVFDCEVALRDGGYDGVVPTIHEQAERALDALAKVLL